LQLLNRSPLAAVLTVLIFLSALILSMPVLITPIHVTHAATTRTISLVGTFSAWNASTNPNPSITVTQGDTVTVKLTSTDTTHLFFVDVDRNGMTPDCPPGADPCSSMFTPTSPTTFTFQVSFAAGTYTYYCSIHPTMMLGNFIVQPVPPVAFQSAIAQPFNNAGTGTATLPVTRNDLIIVAISIHSGYFSSVRSVTDGLGNSYNHLATDTDTSLAIDIWDTNVTAAGSATITVVLNSLTTQFVIAISRYSGVQSVGPIALNAGNCCTTIDINQYHRAFGSQTGIHWGVGVVGATGTATMTQNTGLLRASATTNSGTGDVSAGIVDVTGNPGVLVGPLINLSGPETSFAAFIELIPFG
jgi:plastocyanin